MQLVSLAPVFIAILASLSVLKLSNIDIANALRNAMVALYPFAALLFQIKALLNPGVSNPLTNRTEKMKRRRMLPIEGGA